MTRLLSNMLAGLRRLARARDGATAVEFALISIPLMLLTFGVLELVLILLVSATLDQATDFAARNIRTGVFQATASDPTNPSTSVSKADFEGLVCRNMTWLKPVCEADKTLPTDAEGRLFVEAQTFSTFGEAGAQAPRDPTNFDPSKTCWAVGNPEDIVVVRTYFKWPIITPLLQPLFENYNHGRLISTTRLFRNEPFNPALRRTGTSPC